MISGPLIQIVAMARMDVDGGVARYEWDTSRVSKEWLGRLPPVAAYTFRFHADILLDLSRSEILSCLLIAEIPNSRAPRALVLRKVSDGNDDGREVFERVGLIDRVILGTSIWSNDWMYLFEDPPHKTVTIV
jgi:hypothetical protein